MTGDFLILMKQPLCLTKILRFRGRVVQAFILTRYFPKGPLKLGGSLAILRQGDLVSTIAKVKSSVLRNIALVRFGPVVKIWW